MCCVNLHIKEQLIQKAKQSLSKYRISAIALNRKGEVLGTAVNTYSKYGIEHSKTFMGTHAERRLMERYGTNIKTIIIMRIGNAGDILPVDPCIMCANIANKLGIKIISVRSGIGGRGFVKRGNK